MRTYEALYIVSPELGEDDIQTVSQEVETLITKDDGTIVRSEIWGKRRLAYEVKKHTDGCYVLLRFQANPETLGKLESYFKLSESVIRYLIQYFDKHRLRVEEEQTIRNEEELQASATSGGRDRGDDRDDFDDNPSYRRGNSYGDDRPARDDRPPRATTPPTEETPTVESTPEVAAVAAESDSETSE